MFGRFRQYVFSTVATRRRSADFSPQRLVSEEGFGILRARLCGAHVPRDKSRAPAGILAGALNTYYGQINNSAAANRV